MGTMLDDLKASLRKKTAEMDEIGNAFKVEDGGVVVSPEQRDAFRKALAEAQEIKAMIADQEQAEAVKVFGAQPANGSLAVAAGAGGDEGKGLAIPSTKTIAQMFTESDQFKDLLKSGGYTMRSAWEVEGIDLGSMWSGSRKDVYTTLPTGARDFGRTQLDPLVPLPQRTVRVRDLFPVQQTAANLIEFFRVTGFTNAASVVPERVGSAFGLKPQSALTFQVDQAPVRLIANWEVAHRNVLQDEPQLQGIINNELLYGLRLHEDYQILSGTGNGDDLRGILNTPGIQARTQASVAGDTAIDAIRRAVTLGALAFYEPTGVVLHPTDWEEMELAKDAENRYILSMNVAVGATQRLWRLNVVDTPAIAVNTALVGAFGLGAQLYDRMQGNIRIAEQHADFFLRNAIVILAEERLALAVKRPESFVKVTLT